MYYEDRDFTARALYYSNKLVTVPKTYYYYFVNEKSIVKKGGNKLQDEHYILARRQVLDFIKGKNINVKIEILDKKMISECCIKLL